MEFTAKVIAEYLGGSVEGDENAVVSTFSKIEEAQTGALTFLANVKYVHYVYETEASVVIVDESIRLEGGVRPTLIRVKNAYDCMAKLLQMYESMKPRKTGVDSLAFVAESATVGEGTYVAPFAYVGDNVKIGRDCVVYPHVVIYHDCVVGDRVILHAGCVIGADGFGFAPTETGYDKIPQVGNVVIEDDVEIGANTCVDRSTMGSTFVRRGVKLDNLVQIAHNTDIGQNTVMSAQVGIAGSTKVGEWCMFAGQVGISGHIKIGDHVVLGAKTGVPQSIESGQALIGVPPMPQRPYFRMLATLKHLPEMYNELRELKKQMAELKQNAEKKDKE